MAAEKTSKKKSPKATAKNVVKAVKEDNERGSRQAILEDLFYDFNRSRTQVYKMNFFRGLFFGFGSVLGATLLVTVVVWLLNQFGDIFPPLADFINNLIETMQQRR